jgi:hypothetical protein
MGACGRAIPVAVATVLLVLSACSSAQTLPPSPEIVEQSDEGERPTIPSEASAQVIRETRLFGDPAPLMSIQQQLGVAPLILDPGTYGFDALGTHLTLEFPKHWRLDREAPGTFWLTRPDAEFEALLPGVGFHRPTGFADPALAGFDGPPTWIMQDLGEWIDAVPQIVVVDSGDIAIGDREGFWWDIDVDPTLGPTIRGCQPGSCVRFMWSGGMTNSVARDLERIRWYEIPDPLGPIVIFVATTDEDFDEITAEIDVLLTGAVVGPSEPNPVRGNLAIAARAIIQSNTPIMIAGIEGLTIDAPHFLDVFQRPGEVIAWRSNSVNTDQRVGLAVPATDLEGNPIRSVDDIISAIEANASTFSSSAGEVLGLSATLVDFEQDGEAMMLLTAPRPGFSSTQAVWPELPKGRAWVIDSPVGPAIVSALGRSDEDLAEAIDRVDSFIEWITFCEPTDSCDGER